MEQENEIWIHLLQTFKDKNLIVKCVIKTGIVFYGKILKIDDNDFLLQNDRDISKNAVINFSQIRNLKKVENGDLKNGRNG